MAKEAPSIDISNIPELERLAEEVRETRTPRVLRRGDEVVAKIVPADALRATLSSRRGRAKSEEDIEAFLSSAGSWADVDTEEFKANLYKRRRSSRPPIKL